MMTLLLKSEIGNPQPSPNTMDAVHRLNDNGLLELKI